MDLRPFVGKQVVVQLRGHWITCRDTPHGLSIVTIETKGDDGTVQAQTIPSQVLMGTVVKFESGDPDMPAVMYGVEFDDPTGEHEGYKVFVALAEDIIATVTMGRERSRLQLPS